MRKKLLTILIAAGAILLLCYFLGFCLNSFVAAGFQFRLIPRLLADKNTFVYFGVFCGVALLLYLLYYYKYFWLKNSKNIIKGKEGDKHILANLEHARFQTDKELKRNFQTVEYAELDTTSVKGIPIKAREVRGKMQITFSPPSHALVIGTTGSGKTTSFVNPTIQILARSRDKPSMLISDPKGELYQTHAAALKKRGYQVKVLDLRNPYNSVRWNPLQRAFENYQRATHLDGEVIAHEDKGCFEFEGKEYYKPIEKDTAVLVKKQQLYDLVYEDLHDIVSVLCPVTNKNEPMWESGARNFILAIALAMLEDSENPELGLTVDKYNFYSITKVATNTDDDCAEMLNYFRNRSPLSKCVSLSKQVLDSSEKTRGSYLSSVFDKLSMFADLSLCALTSTNEIEFGSMGEKSVALFLQIPDEKETRHTLASMAILQAYKELVFQANTYSDLTLPKPVYFLLDEFGNLPQIHKLEQMITVGRSRNIWLNLVVQSYAQLAKTYDDKSADIIKSNCNTQIFIGTTDHKTIEEFSKRCGNYSIIQRSVGFNSVKAEDINSNSSVKERPLIYPTELQQLNRRGNMGNMIVTVFGYLPVKSYITPSYASALYDLTPSKQKQLSGRYFDEANAFYDMRKRNAIYCTSPKKNASVREQIAEKRRVKLMIERIREQVGKELTALSETERNRLDEYLQDLNLDGVLNILTEAMNRTNENVQERKTIADVIERLKEIRKGGNY